MQIPKQIKKDILDKIYIIKREIAEEHNISVENSSVFVDKVLIDYTNKHYF